MDKSELSAILKTTRSHAHNWSNRSAITAVRKGSVQRGQVAYDPATSTYTLQEFNPDQTFEFDNIDLVAIELYDLLTDN